VIVAHAVTEEVFPVTQGARTTSYGYDAFGNVSTITDPLGRSVSFSYDGANRVTGQTLPDGRIVGYAYDANGNVTSITPPGRPAHRFSFTALNKEASYVPPAIDTSDPATTYTYSLDRELTSIVRPGGDRADYTYDPAGKLTTITTPTATYSYTYGVNGCSSCGGGTKPESVARNGETLTYTYDGSLLLSTTSRGAVSGSVEWSYDNEFRVIGQSVNGADNVAYAYDAEGLLKSVGQLTLTRNNATGFLSGTSMNGVTTSYGYNPFGETINYNAKAGGASVYDVAYTRDGAGRIVGKTETVNGQTTAFTYGYDRAGRLTSVSENGAQTASYSYDSNGNRITADERGTVSQGYYDLQDRLTKYGATTYTYTPNGELKTKTDASGTTSYSYDFYGNLTKVALGGSPVQLLPEVALQGLATLVEVRL
jgi:YD repeat-containing protein